jgi:hypothetical protein
LQIRGIWAELESILPNAMILIKCTNPGDGDTARRYQRKFNKDYSSGVKGFK